MTTSPTGRCPATIQSGGRTIRCEKSSGHDGTCGWHRAGGQGGTWTRWWGANPEPRGDLTFASYADLQAELVRLRHFCREHGLDPLVAWKSKTRRSDQESVRGADPTIRHPEGY